MIAGYYLTLKDMGIMIKDGFDLAWGSDPAFYQKNQYQFFTWTGLQV
jgi:hypothetical protein